ncbi:MAG: HigA family addiction module antidote protein [Acidimicrobiia bacterium]|nr:HigA family addiction module antidote protein [Acidimicrobiia bacterium]
MLPKHREPSHPGEILQDILEGAEITQQEAADRMGMPFQRVNSIVRRRRGVTADTALLLSALTKTTPEFWLNVQSTWDLWHALRARGGKVPRIRAIA